MSDMQRWQSRPSLIIAGAFVGGVAVAALAIALLVLLRGDDDGDGIGDQQAVATATAGAVPTGGPGVAPQDGATATPGQFDDPDEALEAVIADEYGSEHIGECPQEVVEGEPVPTGICSIELYRSAELVTFILGEPFSEAFGEAVITRSEDGVWSASVIEAAPFEEQLVIGSKVVTFGAGSCLNFRDSPSVSGTVQSCRIDGTAGEIVEGPQEADGHTWWRLDGLGWGSGEFLRLVGE